MDRRMVDAGFPLTHRARRAETTAASVSDLVCNCVVDDAPVSGKSSTGTMVFLLS